MKMVGDAIPMLTGTGIFTFKREDLASCAVGGCFILTFSSGHFFEGSGQKQPLQFPTFFV